ncbi:MAG: hypothetical protein ACTSU5_17835 [Promethearchaeota archaeon]
MTTNGAGSVEGVLLDLAAHLENDVVYTLSLATGVAQRLEDPRHIDDLSPVLDEDARDFLRELNPKNVNRFGTIKRLVELIYPAYTRGKVLKGFDYWRKWMVGRGLLSHQREHGGGWQGFGGVHSHYYLSHLGQLYFNLQSFFLLDPPVEFGSCVQEDRVEFYLVVERVVGEARTVVPTYPLFPEQRPGAIKRRAALFVALMERFFSKRKVKYEDVAADASRLLGKPVAVEELLDFVQTFIDLFEKTGKVLVLGALGNDLLYLYDKLTRYIRGGEF